MKIEKADDIFIPRKEIAVGTGWENEIRPFINAYADFMGKGMQTPTTDEELRNCENNLRTTLPADMRLFYKTFGPAKLQEGLFDVNDFRYLTKDCGNQFLKNYSRTEQDVLFKLIVFDELFGKW